MIDYTAPDPNFRTIPSPDEQLVRAEQLRDLAVEIYLRVGLSPEDAGLVSALQVETDLRGVFSHGTRLLPTYISQIKGGRKNPKPEIQVVKEGPSYALVDGGSGLGHLTGTRAMELAVDKARQTGIAAVGVRNSSHFGAGSNFVMRTLEHGMIGFCVSSSTPAVAPYGGNSGVLGNYPMAYAIPAKEEPAIVLDMACGVSAWGRITTMELYGIPLADNWALNKDALPTNNPAEASILFPFGGVKGYCLTMIMDVMGGILPFGLSTCHRDRKEFHGQARASHFFYAINIACFISLDEFIEEVDRTIRTVRESKRSEGVERIYLPGEIEWMKKQAWGESGIPIHKKHLEKLADLADELGVSVPWR